MSKRRFEGTRGCGMTLLRRKGYKNRTGNQVFNEAWMASNAKRYIELGLPRTRFINDMRFTEVDPNVIGEIFDES